MNILISNDDGINAKGLHVLADAIAQMDDVNIYICAPDIQRSCCGHALVMAKELFVREHDCSEFNSKTLWAAECTGFPADCVRIGLFELAQRGITIDLVCAGINHGSNFGTDVFYSGTLAAAREAAVCFTQAIAFSLCSGQPKHFEHFLKLVPDVISKAYKRLPTSTCLNVNVPDVPAEEIKGVKTCRLGRMDYDLSYEYTKDGGYLLPCDLVVGKYDDMNWDVVAGERAYITLTPCDLLPYDPKSEAAVKELGISF